MPGLKHLAIANVPGNNSMLLS